MIKWFILLIEHSDNYNYCIGKQDFEGHCIIKEGQYKLTYSREISK